MSSNVRRSQLRFQTLFGGPGSEQWHRAKPSVVISRQLTKAEALLFTDDLRLDSIDFYFKGLLSLSEALNSVSNQLYSWATVKLYYSVFYFLSCSLASLGFSLVRRDRELYYIKAREGQAFIRTRDNTDHKGTIFLFEDQLKGIDKLQTNTINGINPYIWIMKMREEVNYKDRQFHEPNQPVFWEEIAAYVREGKLEDLVELYIKDNYVYCFQEEHACLALPIKRLILTKQSMINENIQTLIADDKKEQIKRLLPIRNKLEVIDELVGG